MSTPRPESVTEGPSSATTRERLLEAAIHCIETKGYANTTARDLSAASGANLASIGYHFGSKEVLLDEALVVACDRWIDPIVDHGRRLDARPVRARAAEELQRFLSSLDANRGTARAFFEALVRVDRSPELRARLAASYEEVRLAVAEGVRAGSSAPHDPHAQDALASAIVALYDGAMVQWFLDPDREVDVEAMVDGLGDALRCSDD